MSEWTPKSAVPADDDWIPASAKTPVKAHARKPRIGAGIGGTVGGLAGLAAGPFAPVVSPLAAGVGGSAGEAIQQAFEGQGLDPRQIGFQGAEQGALQAVGGVAGKGISLLGKPIMQAALRATPEVAQTAIRAGITATKEGANKIRQEIGKAGQAAMGIARQATGQGIQYDQNAIAKEIFKEMSGPLRGLPGDKERRTELKILTRQFLSERNKPVTPIQLHLSKQRADELASKLHETIARGGKLTAREDLALVWYKNYADRARQLLEPIPGYKSANDATRELIEVNKALSPSARKGVSFGQRALERGTLPTAGAIAGGTRGESGQERAINAALGAGLGAGIGTPQALSWLALQAQNPAIAQLIALMARGGRLATQPTE